MMSLRRANSFFSLIEGFGMNTRRCVSTSSLRRNIYRSDDKTTVRILNTEPNSGIMVDSYNEDGFRLNNGVFCFGPTVVFPRTVFCWRIRGDDDISADSISLFNILEPKLDLLIVGYANTGIWKPKVDKIFMEFRKRRKLNVEFLHTPHAVSLYNFLSGDRRFVAAALIPPATVNWTDDDTIQAQRKKKALYNDDD